MYKWLRVYVIFLGCMLVCTRANANNIVVSNVAVEEIDTIAGMATIRFDVSWENSWRRTFGPPNWDAAWVFVKVKKGNNPWQHVVLNATGHTAPAGSLLSLGLVDTSLAYEATTNPGVGVFVYRATTGSGTFSASNVRLRWNYGISGIDTPDVVSLQVFAIEMVYVPEGAFYAGDNATSTASLKQGSSDNDPWYISGEGALSVTGGAGNGTGSGQTGAVYYYVSNGNGGEDASGAVFTVPAAYPKGYGAVYVMKYEITQGGYVEFFNTLTDTQKVTRDITGASGKNSDAITFRNNVNWSGGSAAATLNGGTHGSVACNYLSWGDLVAYLDWAGLRPMSELEYEKMSRGVAGVMSGEYPWGTTNITAASSIVSDGLSTELAGNVGANAVYGNMGSVQGPLRVGLFAGSGTTREGSGASYYGVMELGGNLWERTVTLGNSTGRAYAGNRHGDGNLDIAGNAAVLSSWPSTSGTGAGFRGGNWSGNASVARLSDRFSAAYVSGFRSIDYGGRGVRWAAP